MRLSIIMKIVFECKNMSNDEIGLKLNRIHYFDNRCLKCDHPIDWQEVLTSHLCFNCHKIIDFNRDKDVIRKFIEDDTK